MDYLGDAADEPELLAGHLGTQKMGAATGEPEIPGSDLAIEVAYLGAAADEPELLAGHLGTQIDYMSDANDEPELPGSDLDIEVDYLGDATDEPELLTDHLGTQSDYMGGANDEPELLGSDLDMEVDYLGEANDISSVGDANNEPMIPASSNNGDEQNMYATNVVLALPVPANRLYS